MITNPKKFFADLKSPYLISLVLIALVPLFPEYISFLLILGAIIPFVKDMRARQAKLRCSTLGKLLLIYCGYLTLTCIISTHPLQSILCTAMWWFMLIVYFIVSNLLTDKDRVDAFLFCVSTIAGVVGLIAIIQGFSNTLFGYKICGVWDWLDKIVFDYVPFNLTLQSFPKRAYSTFPNPNMLAQYLVMAAPFVVCFNFAERRNSMRLFNRICLVLTFGGVMLSYSRGGYLAVVSLALVIIFLNIRKRFSTVLLYVATALLFIPQDVYNRLTTLSDSGRKRIWAHALSSIAEKPLFGYGAGTEPAANLFREIGISAPHAHNIPLQLLLEGGIPALLLMFAIAIVIIKYGLRLIRNGYTSSFWIGFALCGFLMGVTLHGLVDYPLTTPKLISFFIAMIAVADRSICVYRDSHHQRLRCPKRKTAKK